MTSKERAELKSRAMTMDSIFQVGKMSLTPALIEAVKAALKARELIKINVLKNCLDDPKEIAEILSERTGSQVVQVIGKKIVLYKKNTEREAKKQYAKNRRQKKKAVQNMRRESAKAEWSRKDSFRGKRERSGKKLLKRKGKDSAEFNADW